MTWMEVLPVRVGVILCPSIRRETEALAKRLASRDVDGPRGPYLGLSAFWGNLFAEW